MGNTCAAGKRKRNKVFNVGVRCLPDEDIIRLQASWKVVSPKWESAITAAFVSWFKQYPEVRPIFNLPPGDCTISDFDIQKYPMLSNHFARFASFIETVIYHKDQHAELIQDLMRIGAKHHGYGAEKKYVTALATNLKLAVCEEIFEGDNFEYETANAWDSLFQFLAGLLKSGMQKAIEEENDNRRTTSCTF